MYNIFSRLNLFKITTNKDFYFAFEVNDFDKFRKAEIIQITYE